MNHNDHGSHDNNYVVRIERSEDLLHADVQVSLDGYDNAARLQMRWNDLQDVPFDDVLMDTGIRYFRKHIEKIDPGTGVSIDSADATDIPSATGANSSASSEDSTAVAGEDYKVLYSSAKKFGKRWVLLRQKIDRPLGEPALFWGKVIVNLYPGKKLFVPVIAGQWMFGMGTRTTSWILMRKK